MLTSEQFVKLLRDALNHLYAPDRLRRSPLIALLGLADRFDAPASLQRILIEAIESFEPEANGATRSHSRRVYDLLLYRYVQQFSQQEVANQLGISVRHLRREQRAALETLAYRLWEQFDLETKLRQGMDAGTTVTPGPEAGPTVNDELAWLKDAPPEQSTDLHQTLPAVLELVQPLAVRHGARLEVELAGDLPDLAVHPVALRQALLNVLGVAIPRASGEQVGVSAKLLGSDVEIRVQCGMDSSGSRPLPDNEEASLDIVRRLADICGGRLILSRHREAFSAALILPALESLPVLVIDDNPDTLQLLQRYASGTRYRLIGTQDPEQAMHLAERVSPQIIVLDVMMPQVDGWEVLGRLRQHPLTHRIPVIVCTILAQEELAFSLGASALLRKPVTRQAFLSALDLQAGPESR